MTTKSKWETYTIPVGMTPVPKYASWDEHREALRREAESYRKAAAERQLSEAPA